MALEDLVRKRLACGKLVRNFFGEFIGTYILILVILSAAIQRHLIYGESPYAMEAYLASGLAVAFGIYAAGQISGAHINPAVSFACFISGKMACLELLLYWVAQYLSAFVASATVFGLYYGSLAKNESIEDWNATSPVIQIFATYPRPEVSNLVGFFDQIFGSGLLIFAIFAITDSRNLKIPLGAVPLCVGLTVSMLDMSFAFNCGASINPAKDLMPRVFAALIVGGSVFTHHDYWSVIAICGQHAGAAISVIIYVIFIGGQLPLVEAETADINSINFTPIKEDFTLEKKTQNSRFIKSEI